MIHNIDRVKVVNEVKRMKLDESREHSLICAKLKAIDIVERLDPDDITGWTSLIMVLENSLEEAKKQRKANIFFEKL